MNRIMRIGIFVLLAAGIGYGVYSEASKKSGSDISANKQGEIPMEPILSSDEHKASAGRFLKLYQDGKRLRNEGQYDKAIEAFEDAYENEAYGRAEKAMALRHIALTYELKMDYELAANYYEGASKLSMNPKQIEELSHKIKELRQKSGVTTSK